MKNVTLEQIAKTITAEAMMSILFEPHGYRYGVEIRKGEMVFVHGHDIGNEIAESERPLGYATVSGDTIYEQQSEDFWREGWESERLSDEECARECLENGEWEDLKMGIAREIWENIEA